MNSTTLRGVFPEQKPVHRRNFIKENMRYIKQMQGLVQNPNLPDVPQKPKDDKFRNVPPKVSSQFHAAVTKSKHRMSQPSLNESTVTISKQPQQKLKGRHGKTKLEIKQLRDFGEISRKEEVSDCCFNDKERITHRGIQTERNEDINKLYDCGVIKYPSPSVIDQINQVNKRNALRKSQDHGDFEQCTDVDDKLQLQALKLEDKPDYIKHNIESIKLKSNRQEVMNTPGSLPPTYQKGVVPKYLKERKDEQLRDVPDDEDCPDGHVLLPEEERKETLRVLRQSYADRIQELNSMPVRNDTLRMRKRKMELEEELKKIDEGIKVFQRPKVFVKINA